MQKPPDHPDFPQDLPQFEHRFSSEADCERYLFEQRWPDGFRCPACNHDRGWLNNRRCVECAACHQQTSLTAGTIMHGSRRPLRTWFLAMWWICTSKTGVSAAGLKRLLGLGSMQTAWSWLQRLRQAMVRPERDPLTGRVQVDDAWLGAHDPTIGQSWKSAIVAVAVESDETGDDLGRIRLLDITDAAGHDLVDFVRREVSRQAWLEVDSWQGYEELRRAGYRCEVISPADDPASPLPRVRRVVGLVRRWLLGTHQGRLSRRYLQAYLDEFVFRYNRRKSPHVGLLFQRLVWQGARTRPRSGPPHQFTPAEPET